jgi:hypothetical protein
LGECDGAAVCDLGACRALHADAVVALASPARSALCRTAKERERKGGKVRKGGKSDKASVPAIKQGGFVSNGGRVGHGLC